MDRFIRNFITNWRRLELPESGGTYIAAVSGGADSVSLALALNELRNREKLHHRFVIAHFNHGLRGAESDADEHFVRDLAVRFGIELAVGHGQVSKQGNLEQNARIARYRFLQETATNLHAEGILTGHTMNDQAETFLINLIRGSGIEGLSGMKQLRRLESGVALIRPLLAWAKRSDTENLCRSMNVEYRYDTMNEDLAFRRVRIRKILIPMLEDLNPKIIETLSKTARLMREGETGEPLPLEISETLTLKDIKDMPQADLYRVLRAWLELHRGDLRGLELAHIEAIESLMKSRKSGKTAELPGGDTVVKESGKLFYRVGEFRLT